MTGFAILILLFLGVALLNAALGALDLWWLRRQPAAPKPGIYDSRTWIIDCPRTQHRVWHPAHRWVRGAWTTGGRPTGHPNWCAGYAKPAETVARPGAR